ncbi:AAA family ATPase [Methylocapsa polymorpha]|uniref:AAA family ATPase n=1 Tax=Methylocapsa polymorpha TaxID=3080828 RepID=A0ABZ0HU77_9HYPH|nr:AAA family ATPase [Methylocapsa sp. RX1]
MNGPLDPAEIDRLSSLGEPTAWSNGQAAPPKPVQIRLKTLAEFCQEYVALAYAVEPVVRASSLYTLTARTGHGKTAFLVAATLAIATGRPDILGLEVTQGRVAFLTFENPDDVRMRFMIAAYALNIDLEPEDGTGDVPAGIVADTKGLTPQRARLARFSAWIASVEADLAKLQSGRDNLVVQIDRALCARAGVAEDVSAGAKSILDRIRAGVEWSLSGVVTPGAIDRAAEVAAAAQQIAVAEKALADINAEIAGTEALLATLSARKPRFAAAAVREAAQGLYADYLTTQDNLREIMTQIGALDAALRCPRPGRLVAVLPDLAGSSGLDELPVAAVKSEIDAAAKVWAAFARALAQDPRAPADMLDFPPHDPKAKDDLVYDRLHPIERRIVDLEFAKKGN